MTSPNLELPEGASTVASIHELQYADRSSVALAANASVIDLIGLLGESIFDYLFGGFTSAIEAIEAGISDFVDDLVGLLTGDPGSLDDLRDWFDNAFNDITTWVELLVDSLLNSLGIPSIGSLFDRITDLGDEIGLWFGSTEDVAQDLINLVTNLITNPMSVIGQLPVGNIIGLAGELADKASTSVVAGVQNFILNLANAILSGIRKVPVVGGAIADRIEDVVDALSGLKNETETAEIKADEAQAQVFELEQIFSVKSSRPLWEGIDPTGESSFPVVMMSEPTNHHHVFSASTGAIVRVNEDTQSTGVSSHHVAGDRSVGALIRISADSTKKQISFVARRTSSSGSLFVDVYQMSPNGSFTLQHSSSDRFADLLTSWAWRQITIPDLSCALGDVVLIQFRGASAQIAGIRMLNFSNALGFRPFQIGWSRTTSTAPSTIVTGDADAAYSPDIPYVQIGEDLGQVGAPRFYSDTFNRSSLGPNWIAMPRTSWGGSGLRIRGNERVENPSNQLIWQSAGSMYALPLSTDSMAVEFDLSGANSKNTGVTMKSNFEGKRGVFLMVTSSGSQIVTTDGGWGTTNRVGRVTSGTGGNGRWRMEYRTSDNRYRVYKDGNLVMQWTDSGNAVRHGLGYRFCGMRIDHESFDSGGWIDNWSAMDIT